MLRWKKKVHQNRGICHGPLHWSFQIKLCASSQTPYPDSTHICFEIQYLVDENVLVLGDNEGSVAWLTRLLILLVLVVITGNSILDVIRESWPVIWFNCRIGDHPGDDIRILLKNTPSQQWLGLGPGVSPVEMLIQFQSRQRPLITNSAIASIHITSGSSQYWNVVCRPCTRSSRGHLECALVDFSLKKGRVCG